MLAIVLAAVLDGERPDAGVVGQSVAEEFHCIVHSCVALPLSDFRPRWTPDKEGGRNVVLLGRGAQTRHEGARASDPYNLSGIRCSSLEPLVGVNCNEVV